MSPALSELWRRTTLGAMRSWLKRIRQPKYAVAIVLVLLWLSFTLLSRSLAHVDQPGPLQNGQGISLMMAIITVAQVGFAFFGYVATKSRVGLSEAETDLLRAAPVSDADLSAFVMGRFVAQFSLLAILLAVLLSSIGSLGGEINPLLAFVGMFCGLCGPAAFCAGLAHLRARASVRRRLRVVGVAFSAAVIAGSAAAFGDFVKLVRPTMDALFDHPGFLPMALFSAPFRMASSPLSLEVLRDLGLSLLLLGGGVLTLRAGLLRSFQQDTMVVPNSLKAQAASFRRGRIGQVKLRRGVRELGSVSSVATSAKALSWTHRAAILRATIALPLSRFALVVLLLGMASAILVVGTPWYPRGTFDFFPAMLPMMMAAYHLFGAPAYCQEDVRSAIRNLELARSLPIDPLPFVRASMRPAAGMTGMYQAMLTAPVAAFAVVAALPAGSVEIWHLGLVAVTGGVAAFGLALVNMAISNLLALWMPGWLGGRGEEDGVPDPLTAMGQAMGTMLGRAVGLTLASLLPAAIGVALGIALWSTLGLGAIAVGLVAAGAVYVGEYLLLELLCAAAWERLDPSLDSPG